MIKTDYSSHLEWYASIRDAPFTDLGFKCSNMICFSFNHFCSLLFHVRRLNYEEKKVTFLCIITVFRFLSLWSDCRIFLDHIIFLCYAHFNIAFNVHATVASIHATVAFSAALKIKKRPQINTIERSCKKSEMFVFKWFRAYLRSDQRHELYLFSLLLTHSTCRKVMVLFYSQFHIVMDPHFEWKNILFQMKLVIFTRFLIIVGCILTCIINSLSTALNQLNVENACRQGRFLRLMFIQHPFKCILSPKLIICV